MNQFRRNCDEGARSREFEPRQGHFDLSSEVEREAFNLMVGGSIPPDRVRLYSTTG